MLRKQSITLDELLLRMENYNNDLKKISQLENRLNQERLLVRLELQKILCIINTRTLKLQNAKNKREEFKISKTILS